MLPGFHPRQSSLPPKKVRLTQFREFNKDHIARVMKNDEYFTKGKIDVLFLSRTQPVPVWVLNDGACPKPEVGDFIVVAFLDAQKNNPYMAGLFSHKAWTSNFIRVEKGMIRVQFPTNSKDVTGADPSKTDDPKNHLRDDSTYLSSRGYVQIDANGIQIHAPSGLPVNITSGTNTSTQPVARVGDTVDLTTGKITSGSSTLKSV